MLLWNGITLITKKFIWLIKISSISQDPLLFLFSPEEERSIFSRWKNSTLRVKWSLLCQRCNILALTQYSISTDFKSVCLLIIIARKFRKLWKYEFTSEVISSWEKIDVPEFWALKKYVDGWRTSATMCKVIFHNFILGFARYSFVHLTCTSFIEGSSYHPTICIHSSQPLLSFFRWQHQNVRDEERQNVRKLLANKLRLIISRANNSLLRWNFAPLTSFSTSPNMGKKFWGEKKEKDGCWEEQQNSRKSFKEKLFMFTHLDSSSSSSFDALCKKDTKYIYSY